MSLYPQVPYDLEDKLDFKRINYRKCRYFEDDNMMVLKSYNTIVAMYDKRTDLLYLDDVTYSSYTSVHIDVFIRYYIKGMSFKSVYIPQEYLISFIRLSLEDKKPNIKTVISFKLGELVKIYRLHRTANSIAQITKYGDSYLMLKNNNEYEFTKDGCAIEPKYYGIEIKSGPYKNVHAVCYPRNLKHLEGGL